MSSSKGNALKNWFQRKREATTLLIVLGMFSGISTQFDSLASAPPGEVSTMASFVRIAVCAFVFPVLFLKVRGILLKFVNCSALPASLKERYPKYDSLTYTVFLFPFLGAFGVQFTFAIWLLTIGIFFFTQVFLTYSLLDKRARRDMLSSTGWLAFLFLISGFAALIYQIVWQKALFTAFGVNIESITVIVSIFMFGLGIGSIAGGILSEIYPSLLPELFLGCEVLTGLFGVVSLPMIKKVSEAVLHGSLLSISLLSCALLCIPTMLMGATLPILVTYLHSRYRNIGRSVGLLYSVNTIGSALACFITADIIFTFFGKQAAVIIAALCNFLVGFLVYKFTGRMREYDTRGISQEKVPAAGRRGLACEKTASSISFPLAIVMSASTGYISLSQEIIWFRAISYITGGKPGFFAHVLGIFLLGLAFGSLLAKKMFEGKKDVTPVFVAAMLAITSAAYYLALPLTGRLLTLSEHLGMGASYLAVWITSFSIGGIFPILAHLGIRREVSIGVSLSWIYFANILGATAGPLFTGFVLMNYFSLEQNALYLSLFTLILSGIVWTVSPTSAMSKLAAIAGTLLCAVIMIAIHSGMYAGMLERLHFKTEYVKDRSYKYVVQNRSGVIAVEPGGTDIIYGGGVYDGRFNIDPAVNTNIITRAYMIAALHPNPEEVLEIGLSGGSWARVIANYSNVRHLTVVEINPGYKEVIRKYPEVNSILNDPKITIEIDDGRRWLNRNENARFDLIVMNTTFHWRDGTTNLLSEEFLRICKHHLKGGGVVYYNSTGAKDVAFTAAHVFRYVTLYSNFVAASDSPFTVGAEERQRNLLKFRCCGAPVFTQDNPASERVFQTLAAKDIRDKGDEIRSKLNLINITDDNMATEFKRINNQDMLKKFYNPELTWVRLLK